ncbi:hypothetical protein FACS1894206_02070 [Deltaproteobacteria bacterium]|nr:hypothetical protein FACS1894206_02070 [Deltaproteobacteria bacterium]
MLCKWMLTTQQAGIMGGEPVFGKGKKHQKPRGAWKGARQRDGALVSAKKQ